MSHNSMKGEIRIVLVSCEEHGSIELVDEIIVVSSWFTRAMSSLLLAWYGLLLAVFVLTSEPTFEPLAVQARSFCADYRLAKGMASCRVVMNTWLFKPLSLCSAWAQWYCVVLNCQCLSYVLFFLSVSAFHFQRVRSYADVFDTLKDLNSCPPLWNQGYMASVRSDAFASKPPRLLLTWYFWGAVSISV